MSRTLLFASLLTLMACPTPPEPNNSPNSTPKNAAPTGNNETVKTAPNSPPPKGGDGTVNPPAGGPNDAKGEVGGPQGQGQPTPPEGEEELKVPSDDEIEKDGSIMGVFNDLGGQELPPDFTQSSVESMEHVSLSGTITCNGEGCDTAFVLRITPSFQPTESDGPLSDTLKQQEGGTITSKEISRGGGEYTILAPKKTNNVVLELLLDDDGDGKASMGEKFVIYEGGGGISLTKDRTDLNFQFTPKALKAPLGGAKPQGGKMVE